MNKSPTGKGRFVRVAITLLFLLLVSPALANTRPKGPPSQIPDATKSRIQGTFFQSPLTFEANQGQTDPRVKFLARGNGYALFLTPTEAVMVLRKPDDKPSAMRDPRMWDKRADNSALSPQHSTLQSLVRMKLAGAKDVPDVVGLEELPGKVNYFKGNDPTKWRTNVSTYAKVEYRDVYPGINLVYYGNQRQLEYDFVVSPGSDPSLIQIAFEETEKMETDAQGDLILHTALGDLKMHKPLVYQEVAGIRKQVESAFVLNSHADSTALKLKLAESNAASVGFQVASYHHTKPLVIDPILVYSTYLGGSHDDRGVGITVDTSGSVYVTGLASSTNFPTANALQSTCDLIDSFYQCGDAFVTKLNATGSARLLHIPGREWMGRWEKPRCGYR